MVGTSRPSTQSSMQKTLYLKMSFKNNVKRLNISSIGFQGGICEHTLIKNEHDFC